MQINLRLRHFRIQVSAYICRNNYLKQERMEEENRYCPNCNGLISGRSDKRFCSDSCRTMYNNRIYRERREEVARIDRILKKNHAIIEKLYAMGERRISFVALFGMGFNFDYMTSLRENPDTGSSFIIGCYDYSYIIGNDGTVVIDRKRTTLL